MDPSATDSQDRGPTDGRTEGQSAPNGWPRVLLDGFRAGEQRALTEVYRLHVKEVARLLHYGFSFSSAGTNRRFAGYASSPFELQDALHETFRLAFEPRARDGYDGLRPYGPYLRTIARNVVLKTFRAREKLFPDVEHDVLASPGADLTVADAPTAPDRSVHDRQVEGLLEDFLASLDGNDRGLVEARFVEGLSQRDAAERLGLGRQRIRTRELRLRKQLLAFLNERGETGLVTNGFWLPTLEIAGIAGFAASLRRGSR